MTLQGEEGGAWNRGTDPALIIVITEDDSSALFTP